VFFSLFDIIKDVGLKSSRGKFTNGIAFPMDPY